MSTFVPIYIYIYIYIQALVLHSSLYVYTQRPLTSISVTYKGAYKCVMIYRSLFIKL